MLPQPSEWEELQDEYKSSLKNETHQTKLMEALLAYLNGDVESTEKQINELRESISKDSNTRHLSYAIKRLEQTFSERETNLPPEDVIRIFEESLPVPRPQPKSLIGIFTQAMAPQGGSNYVSTVNVPDFVTLIGEEKAKEVLLRALAKRVRLRISNADATLRLAQSLALENIDVLAVPQWDLVDSIDQAKLYKKFAERFPSQVNNTSDYRLSKAKGYYFWGLVVEGKSEEAMQILSDNPGLEENLPYGVIRKLKNAGYSNTLWDFLDTLLNQYPHVDLWDDYIELSSELSRENAMLETIQKAISLDTTTPESRIEKQYILGKAYLATGKLEDAIELLQKILEINATTPAIAEVKFDAGKQLAQVGLRLERSDWSQLGINAAISCLPQFELVSEYGSASIHNHMAVVRLCLESNRTSLAVEVIESLTDNLDKAGALQVERNIQASKNRNDPYNQDYTSIEGFRADNSSAYQEVLTALLSMAIEANDFEKANQLLNQRSEWMVEDILSIIKTTDAYPKEDHLGYLAARVHLANGDTDAANTALKAMLLSQNGYDSAYALYLKINGSNALPFLKILTKVDQFEERPLIWQAQHFVNTDELESAEQLAKQAIAIDPSDGEQPRDDRMRAYDIMRQIRHKQGNAEEVAFFAGVLKAIRLSESADRFYSAGLYREAINRYRDSLSYFQDAYCIQSRLAVRLYDEGNTEEAYVHYRKAYELMPSSFGRVESHCFGCESVFKGDTPQAIAAEVFSSLLISEPEVPQVHYLIGYLRDYQDKEVEALKHFQDAVALDPEYLNAWKKIASLSRQMTMDPEAKDTLYLKIYNLDPLGNHSSPNLREVSDLKRMWQTVTEQIDKLKILPEIESIYPLKAAIKASANLPKQEIRSFENRIHHPVDVLAENRTLQAFESTFIALSR